MSRWSMPWRYVVLASAVLPVVACESDDSSGQATEGDPTCSAAPTCATGETQYPTEEACFLEAESCAETSACGETFWCAPSSDACAALPVCESGDLPATSAQDCEPPAACYEATLCGNSIQCVEVDDAAECQAALDAVQFAPVPGVEGRLVDLRIPKVEPSAALTFSSGPFASSPEPELWNIRLPYAGDADTNVTVVLACGDLTREVPVVLSTTAITWMEPVSWTAGSGPPAREYFPMWLDDGSDTLWVYGGFHYEPVQFTVASDLWSLDLSTWAWTSHERDAARPQAAGGGFAVGPTPGVGLHYGGLARDEDDEFVLPFAFHTLDFGSTPPTWASVDVPEPPWNGAYQPAFIYDAPRQRYVSLCGTGVSGPHCDVGAFDAETNTWTSLAVEAGPSGRTGSFWVHDTLNERIVIFSGEQGGRGNECNCAGDTWAFDLTQDAWVALAPAGDPPPPRRNGATFFDSHSQRMFVWGGTADGATTEPGLFALDLREGLERWTLIEVPGGPTLRASAGAVFDAASNRALLGFGNNSTDGAFADLWQLNL